MVDIDLRTLNSKQGFRILGERGNQTNPPTGDQSGWAVSGIGDINKDGFDDFIIGASRSSPSSRHWAGTSYVIFGKAVKFSDIDLEVLSMPVGFKIVGAISFDESGAAVDGGFDINHDGYADIIIGAWDASRGRGTEGVSYVIFGKASGFSNIDLGSLTMPVGFQIRGAAMGDDSGFSVSGLGDINGDGFDDIVIGAPYASVPGRTNSGASYIIFGKASGFSNIDLGSLSVSAGIKIIGAKAYDYSGYWVSAAGDIDQDGFGDIVIGAYRASPLGRTLAGESYVIFGKPSGLSNIDLASLTMPAGFKVIGAISGDHSGYPVRRAGDVNNDGFDDIVIGAGSASPLNRTNAGVSYIIFGKRAGFSDVDLRALGSAQGFKILGSAGEGSGWPVNGAGDVNNDGFDDVIIGAKGASPLNRTHAGISYVIFGNELGNDIDLENFNSRVGFKILGAAMNDNVAYSVSKAGDLNKDGLDDIVIGTINASPLGRIQAGESYVIYGKGPILLDLNNLNSTQGIKARGERENDRNGNAVGGNVDLNDDGIADVIIGAASASPLGRTSAGEVTVIFGKKNGTLSTDVPGFKIIGSDPLDNAGCSISTAGDINADRIGDIIIGANMATPPPERTNAGISYVIYGQKGSSNQTVDLSKLDDDSLLGFKVLGANAGDLSGSQVLGGFDINSDGISDVIIVTNSSLPLSTSYRGEAYVLYGRNGGYSTIDLNSTFLGKGFRIFGEASVDKAVFTVSSGFDINADNITDIIVGSSTLSPLNRTYAGLSYVIYGRSSNHFDDIDLSKLNITQGFKIFGSQEYEFSGQAVASAGDVNHDGISDIFISAPGNFSCFNLNYTAGTSYVLYGRSGGYEQDVDLAALNTTDGFRIFWENYNTVNRGGPCQNFTMMVSSIASIGDVSGDGIDDIMIGLKGASHGNRTQNGLTYIIYGQQDGYFNDMYLGFLSGKEGTKIIGAKSFDASGNAVALAGDFNGDGINDIVIGAYNASTLNLTQSGEAYIVYGGRNFNESYNHTVSGETSYDHTQIDIIN